MTLEQEERYQRIRQNIKNPKEVNYNNVEMITLYKPKPKNDIGHKEQRFILQERDWKCGALGFIHTNGIKDNSAVVKKLKRICRNPEKRALKKFFRELEKRGIKTEYQNSIMKK